LVVVAQRAALLHPLKVLWSLQPSRLDASTPVGASWLEDFCSGAVLWVSIRAAFPVWRSFWFSGGEAFRLWRNAVVGAAGGGCNVPTAPQQGAAADRLIWLEEVVRWSYLLVVL